MIAFNFRVVGLCVLFGTSDISKLVGLGHISLLVYFRLSRRVPTAEQSIEILVSYKVNG